MTGHAVLCVWGHQEKNPITMIALSLEFWFSPGLAGYIWRWNVSHGTSVRIKDGQQV